MDADPALVAVPRTCSVATCKGELHTREMCAKHYQQMRRGRPSGLDDVISAMRDLSAVLPCFVGDCERPMESLKSGSCLMHYQRRRTHGSYAKPAYVARPVKPYVTPTEKRCPRCEQIKPADSYNVRGDGRLQPYCRPCHMTYSKAVGRQRRLAAKYGLSLEDYDRLLQHQGGKCAICGDAPGGRNTTHGHLYVDHCHSTGRVRGLLCHGCNVGLGFFGDDPERVDVAAAYLRKES